MTRNPINEAHEAIETSEENVKREVVIPGEVIVKGEDYLPSDGTRREGENVLASRFGLSEVQGRVVKVIPIFGAFVPRRNNVILGRVTDLTFNGWLVDIEAAGQSFLPLEECPRFINRYEMDQFLAIGDVISAKIMSVKSKGIDLTIKGRGLGKLEGGFLFRVIPSRVPRVIGREGSMITLIKEKTGCNITIGQNGWVWIKGDSIEKELNARKAIEFVTEKAYVEGLTEKMEEWFNNQEKKK
jgi:exosome complex component RRP4